jgi:hypothetical protein
MLRPNALPAANKPVPNGTPKRCGIVALKPNLAPDAVSITTFGPGENNPNNTNNNNGRVSVIIGFLKESGSSKSMPQKQSSRRCNELR